MDQQQSNPEQTEEDKAQPDEESQARAMEKVQEEAAAERANERGYQ